MGPQRVTRTAGGRLNSKAQELLGFDNFQSGRVVL